MEVKGTHIVLAVCCIAFMYHGLTIEASIILGSMIVSADK